MTEDGAIARFAAENPGSAISVETYAFNISRLERVTLGRLRAEHRSATKATLYGSGWVLTARGAAYILENCPPQSETDQAKLKRIANGASMAVELS